ncbi:unnamed protein product [Rhizophagus irregularis]|nr:unnamed protein product [Rhizophagus irregularis]
MKREYITEEHCLDINDIIQSKSLYLIPESESINSSSIISFDIKQEYISKEYEFDIVNKNQCLSFQSSSNIYHSNVIYPSRPLNQLISTVNSSKKRNIEELEIEVRNDRNNGKHIKIE